MPKVRTATIATIRVRMTGSSLARTMSQPDVAVSAMPDAVAAPPSSPPRIVRRVGRSRVVGWVLIATTSAPSRVSTTCRSARADELGAVGHHDDRAALAEVGEHVVHQVRGRRRRGARSARRRAAPARWTGSPGPGRPARAARRTGRTRRHRAGSRAPAAGRRRSPRGRRGAGRPRGPGRRRRCPSTRASRSVPAGRNGRWVTRWARPARTVPAVGVRSPAASSRRVDLPTPEGPVTAVRPGPASRWTPTSTGLVAPG